MLCFCPPDLPERETELNGARSLVRAGSYWQVLASFHCFFRKIFRCFCSCFCVQFYLCPARVLEHVPSDLLSQGFGAYQRLAQKIKVPFFRIFSFFLQF